MAGTQLGTSPAVGGYAGARRRAFVKAQALLLGATVVVLVEGVWAMPDAARSGSATAGVAMIALVSLAVWISPWMRWPVEHLMVLAAVDVVGAALVRVAYHDQIPAVGLLAVFPLIWTAYAFPERALLLTAMCSTVVATLPIAIGQEDFPDGRVEIASVVTLPVLLTFLAMAVGEAARQLARGHRRLRDANEALRASLVQARDAETLIRTLFDSIDVAMAFYDQDGRLLMSNALAGRMATAAGFEIAAAPYVGDRVRGADNKTPTPGNRQAIPRALTGDLEPAGTEWIGSGDEETAVVTSARRVHRADQSLWGTLITAYDITELARSINAKDDILAAVSHELRTPLTTIVGNLELLEDEIGPQPDAVIDRRLSTMRAGAQRLQDRIQELIDVARPRFAQPPSRVELRSMVSRLVADLEEQAALAGIRLELAPGEECWASVGPAAMSRALDQILSNALKYTPRGGRVAISVATSAQELEPNAEGSAAHRHGADADQKQEDVVGTASSVIAVTDTGWGMAPDEVSRCFEPFWRSGSARSQAIPGLGIGLTFVRRAVTEYGGHVAIESSPGRGTTVAVTLPADR